MKKYSLIFVLLTAMLILSPAVQAAKYFTLEESLTETAEKIGSSTRIPSKANLAVVGFVESTSRTRLPLSSVLEDDLTSFLTEKRPGHLVAKNNIDTVLRELRITRDDLFDSRHRKQFGKLVSADLLVSGNYWINRRDVIINIAVIDIESGLALLSHRVKIRKSQFAKYLLGLN